MECLIITGLSGAGKSQAEKYIEDLGYFCVDNMIPELVPSFIDLCLCTRKEIEKIAFVIDTRSGTGFDKFISWLNSEQCGVNYKIIYLEAKDDVIVRRYKESRRKHPLAGGERVVDGLKAEREMLRPMRDNAEIIIDTSDIKPQQLRNILYDMLDEKNGDANISVTVISFGFKYGIPIDADIVFDVRFLPNPFYIKELKDFTGMDKTVSDFVLSHEQTQTFLSKLTDMIEFLLPHYKNEGKQQLVIAIGCTGGKHRSVAIAEKLFEFLTNSGVNSNIIHRDYMLDGQNKR